MTGCRDPVIVNHELPCKLVGILAHKDFVNKHVYVPLPSADPEVSMLLCRSLVHHHFHSGDAVEDGGVWSV